MTLKESINEWLEKHPNATAEQAIWAGACIEMKLWIEKPTE